MPPLVKNILKNAALGFAAGAIAAFLLPPIAAMLDIPTAVGHLANPWWLGSFCGVLNAGTSLVQPALDYLFGDNAAPAKEEPKRETKINFTVQVAQAPQKQPEQAQTIVLAPSSVCNAESVAAVQQQDVMRTA